jgi:hypothetical protein
LVHIREHPIGAWRICGDGSFAGVQHRQEGHNIELRQYEFEAQENKSFREENIGEQGCK